MDRMDGAVGASLSDGKSLLPKAKSTCGPVRVANPFWNIEASAPIRNNWGITEVGAINFSFIWKIKNFSLCPGKTREYLRSPSFFAGRDNEYEWCLRAFPQGNAETNKNHLTLSLGLVSCSSHETEILTKFKIFILNAKNEKSHGYDSEATNRYTIGQHWGWSRYIELDSLLKKAKELLPEDNLTILCEGRIADVCTEISGHLDGFQTEDAGSNLSEDFGSLFEKQKLSDVTLAVGQKEFLVHKAVLAARSPVFAAMFEHEMKESKRNRVVVKDVDYEVLGEMLQYIYTGRSPNVKSMAEHLLATADKYDVAGLKLMCQEVLCAAITTENAVNLLILADRHCAEQLKIQASYFVKTNVKDIICTPAWKQIILTFPNLLAEVFETV